MVVTPWGDSDQLRSRKLRPVRGASPDAVAESQRERLFGAMVACVSRHGLAGTTLAELVEVSGVSSRSFYGFFPDKSACLTAAVSTIVADARRVMHRERPEDDLETQLRGDFRAFAEGAIRQPAAA
jgi:AcrR family transcriptional regulator